MNFLKQKIEDWRFEKQENTDENSEPVRKVFGIEDAKMTDYDIDSALVKKGEEINFMFNECDRFFDGFKFIGSYVSFKFIDKKGRVVAFGKGKFGVTVNEEVTLINGITIRNTDLHLETRIFDEVDFDEYEIEECRWINSRYFLVIETIDK